MQPLNDKLEGLSRQGKSDADEGAADGAVELGQKWIRGNYLRILCPFVAAALAMVQIVA